jgi:L-threonylcarbamoyladenylate synthase
VPPQHAPFTTQIRPYGKAAIAEAAALILDGLPVAVPTETVYGLAADATRSDAVQRIYDAKGRPGFNPLIVHVLGLEEAEAIADLPDGARAVARAYWPGALTIVAPLKAGGPIAQAATAGLPTVAIRAPAHRAMRALLEASDRPLAAPSANASGGISPTSADHVLKTLDGRIPLIIDDGNTQFGLESTIISFAQGKIALLRPGPIDFAELAALAQLSLGYASGKIEAPGQMQSHYAPSKRVRLEAMAASPDEWLIGFGSIAGHDNLSPEADLTEAAARLFQALHRAEAQGAPRIAIAPIPHHGLGIAINDRLRRAAAPR